MSFLAREAVQERLRKRIEDVVSGFRQNIGIIGPVGVGKSSLFRDFFQSISRDHRLLPVYIKGETIDGRQLAEQWMGAILCSVMLGRTLNIPASLNAAILEAEPIIPSTVQAVKHIQRLFQQEKNSAAVRELFGLPLILARETGKRVVLMIDEFHELGKLPVPDAFAILGKQIMPAKEVLYLVTSSARDRAIEIFREKLSLLFGNFEVLEIAPLGFVEVEQYIAARMPAHRWPPALIRFLSHMTNGEPIYLDLITQRIESLEVREIPQPVSAVALIDAFCQELFDRRGRIALLFEQRLERCVGISKNGGTYLRALVSLSQGRHKLIPIAASVGETVAETTKVLKRLVLAGMVVKSGSFYHLPDSLFRFWLREVYLKRHSLFLPEDRSLRKSLFDKLNAAFDSCERNHHCDVGSRVEALLKEFRNDTVEFGQKKFRCPQFSEISLRSLPNATVSILAKGGLGRWHFFVSAEWIGEADIEAMIQVGKGHRKIRKRILIALNGIDENAKLIAQESRMHLWGLRHLNAFMDYYDLRKIIITTRTKAYDTQAKQEGSSMGAVAQGVPALESR